jgi:hypothetical protein
MEVAGANRRWRGQFRYRGSHRESAVAQLFSLDLMRRALIILLVLVVVGVVWIYLFTGTPPWGPKLTLKDTAISFIELTWVGTSRTIQASNQCAEVLQTMRQARQSPVPASPPFGSMTLYYADGTTNRFFLQPSGRLSGLEIVGDSGGYAISMHQMLSTFESVGLLTKDTK